MKMPVMVCRVANMSTMNSIGQIIIVDGSIGVGKSTFCFSMLKRAKELIGPDAEVDILLEPTDPVFLDAYIRNQKRYAFCFQVYMARNRIETMRKAERLARLGRTVFIDRGLPGDLTFASMHRDKGNFTDEEWSIYCNLLGDAYPRFLPSTIVDPQVIAASHAFASSEGNTRDCHISTIDVANEAGDAVPTRIVYFKATPECAFKRLKQRGNASEIAGYTIEYFRQLCAKYDETMAMFPRVVTIDYERDFDVDTQDGMLKFESCEEMWNKICDSFLL